MAHATQVNQLEKHLEFLEESVQGVKAYSPIDLTEEAFDIKLDPWQCEYFVHAEEEPRIAIVASRQSGKSTASAGFAAWCMVYIPGFQVLIASRSLRQATHYMGKLKICLRHVLTLKQFEKLNDHNVILKSGSAATVIPCQEPDAGRGFSPDLVILDEAAFAPDALFAVISPSLAATGGAMHMISSANGPQGQFYAACEGDSEDQYWTRKVTAHDCPRISQEFLDTERKTLGDVYYRQEYFSEFLSPLGAFFSNDSLKRLFDGEDAYLDDIEGQSDKPMPDLPTGFDKDDLRAAFDRTDRVRQLLYQ